MLQKQSRLSVIDNTGALSIQIFHMYQGFFRKTTGVNFYVRVCAKAVKTPRVEYKGYKHKPILKGFVNRALIVRSRFRATFLDTSSVLFKDNAAFILKRKNQPRSAHFSGPISKKFDRRNFIHLFDDIV